MRTKTLLMTAAVLAAGVISSQAQAIVYSQNVVGYITQPSAGGHKYTEFANQLINGSDVNQSNNNVNAVLSSGLISGTGAGDSNTVMLVFNGVGYVPYYFFNANDAAANTAGTTAGWYDSVGNPAAFALPQGGSVFLQNNFSAATTVTITGTVLQGTNNLVTIPNGYSLLSLGTPVSTNVDAPGIGLPGWKLTSYPNNDEYIFWNGTAYVPFYYYNQLDAAAYTIGFTPGFYDSVGNPCTTYPAVGQGFLFLHNGPAFTYTNTFEVQ